ncbi:hypothetical protein ACFYUY_01535 [Kitasatospora sp. NPDC004745]|uniref:hypothetical protein n=1 Tax=Kitasatospora sp. NPDC004745 TaxID=3364019 RepID=UPI0036CBCB93
MIAVTVARPTENLAVARTPLIERGSMAAYWLALRAKAAGDTHGALLFAKRYVRAVANGNVGEAL